jgi:hypothetical protein
MAIQTQGTTGNVMEVDTTFKAARTSIRPPEVLGWNSLGAQSGLITGLAATNPAFAFRNASANLIMVRRVGIGFVTTTAFTAAQTVDFGLLMCRNFTVPDSGGTVIALTGNNAKHRSSLATSTNVDCRIATTASLGAGTRTLDANHIGQVAGFSGAAGLTIPVATDNLLQHAAGDYPLVLAQNEGFEIACLTAMGAAGVGKLYVNMEFGEMVSY